MNYKVTFSNCPSVIVWATNRADAISQAVKKTRGYLSFAAQKRNVISSKQTN